MGRIVFDLDGTLIDSAPDLHGIANEILAAEGREPVTLDEARDYIGNGASVFVAKMRAARDLADSEHERLLAAFVVATSIITVSMTLWLAPGRLFWLPTHAPELWRTIIIFYPIVSVLPQSIIYRALFFSRYRPVFPSDGAAIAANAFMFGLAHLFYLNWVAFLLTALGGAVFAWVHYKRESYWFANLLHAIGGWAVFTSGLGGAYFYHGAI